MSSRSPREIQAKAISLLTGMLRMLDVGNPNNRAFKLVTIFVCVCGLILSYNNLIFAYYWCGASQCGAKTLK